MRSKPSCRLCAFFCRQAAVSSTNCKSTYTFRKDLCNQVLDLGILSTLEFRLERRVEFDPL